MGRSITVSPISRKKSMMSVTSCEFIGEEFIGTLSGFFQAKLTISFSVNVFINMGLNAYLANSRLFDKSTLKPNADKTFIKKLILQFSDFHANDTGSTVAQRPSTMLTRLMIDATTHAPSFQPDIAVRLPLVFDIAPLVAEINALSAETWRVHFNTSYHDGGWTGIPLLTANGKSDSLYAPINAEAADTVKPTVFGHQCPLLLATVAQLQCRVKSARILRLASGSVIREHSDDDLLWLSGEARLHIPLQTNDRVEFYVDGRRIVMRAGECWYLNLSKPHRVQNLGTAERLHLVLDCAVNEWLSALVQSGFAPSPHAHLQDGASHFSQFRDVVFNDPDLQAVLRNCTHLDELIKTSVALGKDHALHFSVEDVHAQASRGRREWLEQWIV